MGPTRRRFGASGCPAAVLAESATGARCRNAIQFDVKQIKQINDIEFVKDFSDVDDAYGGYKPDGEFSGADNVGNYLSCRNIGDNVFLTVGPQARGDLPVWTHRGEWLAGSEVKCDPRPEDFRPY